MRLAGLIGGAARGLVQAGQPIVMEGIREKAIAKRDAKLQEYKKQDVEAAAKGAEAARIQGLEDERGLIDYRNKSDQNFPQFTANQSDVKAMVAAGFASNEQEAWEIIKNPGGQFSETDVIRTAEFLQKGQEAAYITENDEGFFSPEQQMAKARALLSGSARDGRQSTSSGPGRSSPSANLRPGQEGYQRVPANPDDLSELKKRIDAGKMPMEELQRQWEAFSDTPFGQALEGTLAQPEMPETASPMVAEPPPAAPVSAAAPQAPASQVPPMLEPAASPAAAASPAMPSALPPISPDSPAGGGLLTGPQQPVGTRAGKASGEFVNAAIGTAKEMPGVAKGMVDSVGNAADNARESAFEIASNLGDGIGQFFDSFQEEVGIGAEWEFIGDDVKEAWNKGAGIAKEDIKNKLAEIMPKAKSLPSEIKEGTLFVAGAVVESLVKAQSSPKTEEAAVSAMESARKAKQQIDELAARINESKTLDQDKIKQREELIQGFKDLLSGAKSSDAVGN